MKHPPKIIESAKKAILFVTLFTVMMIIPLFVAGWLSENLLVRDLSQEIINVMKEQGYDCFK